MSIETDSIPNITIPKAVNRNNPYFDLIKSLPELVFSSKSQKPTYEEVHAIKSILTNKIIHLEIGSGSGQHLVKQAQTNPDKFFVGIEIRYKRAYKTAEKAKKLNLKNLFVIRTDAEYLSDIFANDSIEKIFINFPDPWDRRRWKKHRLTAPEYLNSYYNLLTQNAFIHFKTDHRGLFFDTIDVISKRTDYAITKHTEDLHNSELKSGNILTEFEQLFISKQMPIFCMFIQKI